MGLSQTEFASLMGDLPNAISKMLAGQKKFIPKKYISFFLNNGYDINSLFDDDKPLTKIDCGNYQVNETKETYTASSAKKTLPRNDTIEERIAQSVADKLLPKLEQVLITLREIQKEVAK